MELNNLFSKSNSRTLSTLIPVIMMGPVLYSLNHWAPSILPCSGLRQVWTGFEYKEDHLSPNLQDLRGKGLAS